MNTVIIDGKEYVLIPREQLQEKPPQTPPSEPVESVLADFFGGEVVDDGLATHKEKQSAIQVITQPPTQDQVVDVIPGVRPATPQRYAYREKFVRHELTPGDIFAPNTYMFGVVKNYKDVEMIESDKMRPPNKQLFYGEGLSVEGSGTY